MFPVAALTETIGDGSLDIYSWNLAGAFRKYFPNRVQIITTDVSRKSADVWGVPSGGVEAQEAADRTQQFIRRLEVEVQVGCPVHVSNQHMARYALLLDRPFIVTDHDAMARAWDSVDAGHTPYIAKPNERDACLLGQDIGGINASVHVITVSHLSKCDLQMRWGIPSEKISVVYEGINTGIFRPPRERFKLDGPYILFVATEDWRKNIEVVLRALRHAKHVLGLKNLHLVKVGEAGSGGRVEGGPRSNTLRLMQELGLKEAEDVIFTGYVPQSELPSLYAGALALIHPSWYEGFGFPPLEAMACGGVAIVSEGTALEEISGPASLVAHPDDYEGIARMIQLLHEDSAFRGELVAKGAQHTKLFTWRSTAAKTLEVYAMVQERLKVSAPTRVR